MSDRPQNADDTGLAGHVEAPLVRLALRLDALTDAYEAAIELFYNIEMQSPPSPWFPRLAERADRLLSECRIRARLLAETPARTLLGAVLKSQALSRFYDADNERDPQSVQVIHSLSSDLEHLAAEQGLLPTVQSLRTSVTAARCPRHHRKTRG
ncbi:hypothetical protein [Paracraurococcus lichenis]|uniref:Uncharacterized protein n=1 Tax=Paracraurococcus lichenis TaxID=3064888 RepID=A0ABT9E9G0_9PROT|nr:hypothetical protein [Paracraurococcus sp. LOR1-02]MDO9712824.1 hypothetical protein [Paracraurococcus sp. LOR1-02]